MLRSPISMEKMRMKRKGGYNPNNAVQQKIAKINDLLKELEEMSEEWKLRIKEANDAKEAYETLYAILQKQVVQEEG